MYSVKVDIYLLLEALPVFSKFDACFQGPVFTQSSKLKSRIQILILII